MCFDLMWSNAHHTHNTTTTNNTTLPPTIPHPQIQHHTPQPHITTQPYNHTTIQSYHHTTTQPHNHTTVRPHNHAHHTFTQTNTQAGDIEPPISAAEAGPSATIVRHPITRTSPRPYLHPVPRPTRHLCAEGGGTTDAPHCDAMASTMRLTIGPLELDRPRVQIKLRQTILPSPSSCSFLVLVTCAPMGARRMRHAATQRREHGRLTTCPRGFVRAAPKLQIRQTLPPSSVHHLTPRSSPARRGRHNGRATLLFHDASTFDSPQARRKKNQIARAPAGRSRPSGLESPQARRAWRYPRSMTSLRL